MANNTQDKRNAKGGGSVRQRADGRWEARCTINGKSRSFYADKQQEALKAMRAAQNEQDEGQYLEPSKMTVGQWFDVWIEEYKKQEVRPSTLYSYRGLIKNHISPALGKIKLQALNPTQIQTFYNTMSRCKGLSPRTVHHAHMVLNSALDQALKLGYIKSNPTGACTLPKKKRPQIEPFDEKEVTAFLEAIENDWLRDLLTVALFTGMRQGEVCGLPWDAVSFKDNTITIKQQLYTGGENSGAHIGPTKNGKTRIITVPSFIMDILRRVRQEQLSNHFKLGIAWKNEWNLVFTKNDGKYIHTVTTYVHFKKYAAKIGRPNARFHDMRHTYAVMSLQAGTDPKTVQENLGHATAAFTLDVYAYVTQKMKRDSADKMEAYYQKIKA